MRRYLPFIIVAGVGLVTLASGAMLYRAKRPAPLTISKDNVISGTDLRIRGNQDASVTLEEFADFQCPPCGTLAPVIKQLEQDYKGKLRVVFRHYPLSGHQHSHGAALAAEAAGMQGRFWDMHDLLYQKQGGWSKAPDARQLFNTYAEALKLDVERFKKDMESETAKARVAADQERAKSIGVTTTPTVLLNNKPLRGITFSPNKLRQSVDEAINPKPPL